MSYLRSTITTIMLLTALTVQAADGLETAPASRSHNSAEAKISPARLIEATCQQLATQLVANLPANKRLRVGILPFADKTSQAGTLAQALLESLRTQLFLSKSFDVVEDTDMQKVLHELRIQEQGQGVLNQDTIQKMGELLAAEALVVGTITDMISDYGVNCRVVPIKSGIIASLATALVPKDTFPSDSLKSASQVAVAAAEQKKKKSL